VFIDALKIAVSDGAITSAASLRNLPGILSCPADLDVLILESNLYTLVNETFCIVNCVSGLVTYDSGKPRSASEGRRRLDGGFLKNEAIHCCKHKSNCQIEPMKITLPSYCEATHDSGVLEFCGMFLTKRDATSLKCEFKASAISCFLVKF
jgi:hypothetical protein